MNSIFDVIFTRLPKNLWGVIIINMLGMASIVLTRRSFQIYKTLHYEKLSKSKQKQKLNSRVIISEREYASSPAGDNQIENIVNMKLDDLILFLQENDENFKVVFNSFQLKALKVDQRLNCIIDYLNLNINHVNLKGPLSGLPISIKDNLKIKGYENYVGCAFYLNRSKADESSVLVRVLEELGGVPFVKTTVPQTMMTICSSNPIDGCTKNPQNVNFQSGGSSSGEAALIGGGGSIIGFGSDIGGSIRIPAAFCGVVGLKPTSGRISKKDKFNHEVVILSSVSSAFGPICRNVYSCVFILRHLFNSGLMSKYDPKVPFIPFKEDLYKKRNLRIGYFTYDESYPVMPHMKRAVEETVARLKEEGHEMIPWKPPRTGRDWMHMFVGALSPDGGKSLEKLLRFEPIDPAIRNGIFHCDFTLSQSIFNWIKYHLFYWLCDPDYVDFYCTSKCKSSSVRGLSEAVSKHSNFQTEVTKDWSLNNLDCVICPAGGFTALPISHMDQFYVPLLSTIFVWNLLDFPAGTVPVTKVTQKDVDLMLNEPLYSSTPTLRGISDAQKDSIGLSVSVQCVALPWQEEMCLNLMNIVEKYKF